LQTDISYMSDEIVGGGWEADAWWEKMKAKGDIR
jgi:hypothetical protein